MSKPEADILTPDPTMNQYAVSLPTAAWNTFLRQRNKIFRGNLQISLLLPEFPRHVAGGASQWKTAASCHCCKVTLGLFMASAERRPGSGAYIHPAAEEDFCPAKTQFQLIEGKMSGNQNWIKSFCLHHYWHSICGLVSSRNHRVGGIFPVATCTLEKPLEKIKE